MIRATSAVGRAAAALIFGLTLVAGPVSAATDPAAIVAATDRAPDDVKQDARRKPAELLAFAGVKPGMAVMDLMTGGGYTAELLARAVGPTGKIYVEAPPAMPDKPKARLAERLKTPAMANAVRLDTPVDAPIPAGTPPLDLVTFILNYHDTLWLPVDRPKMLKAVYDGLKPGGAFVIVDHAAKAGDGATVGKTLHRIEESVVVNEVTAAGFKPDGHADFLRNPADPKTKAFFDMDGPTDQFVLKFRKP